MAVDPLLIYLKENQPRPGCPVFMCHGKPQWYRGWKKYPFGKLCRKHFCQWQDGASLMPLIHSKGCECPACEHMAAFNAY